MIGFAIALCMHISIRKDLLTHDGEVDEVIDCGRVGEVDPASIDGAVGGLQPLDAEARVGRVRAGPLAETLRRTGRHNLRRGQAASPCISTKKRKKTFRSLQ